MLCMERAKLLLILLLARVNKLERARDRRTYRSIMLIDRMHALSNCESRYNLRARMQLTS